VSRSIKVALLVSIVTVVSIYLMVERGRSTRATRALHVLPSSARAVLRIDLSALNRSGAARSLLERAIPEGALTEIESTCGFDPARDLAEVIVWVRGTDREPLESFGLMLTGKTVDAARLAQCHHDLIAARGGQVVRLDAPTGPMLAGPDHRSAVAIAGERTVVTGSVETVAEAMAVRLGLVAPLEQRAAVARLWSELSPGAALAAAVEPPEHWQAALARGTAFDEESSAFEGVGVIGLRIGGRDEHTASLRLEAATPELAASSANRLRTWVASPPWAVGPPWDVVLRSGEVTRNGRQVALRLDLSSLASTP